MPTSSNIFTMYHLPGMDVLKITKNMLNSLYRGVVMLILFEEELDTDSKLKLLGFLSIKDELLYNKSVLLFKILNYEALLYLRVLLSEATSRYSYLNLIKAFARIDIFQISLAFSGADTWNKLPTKIKSIKSIT